MCVCVLLFLALLFPKDELYMTSVSWVIPALDQQTEEGSLQQQPGTPSINTCRPMSYQEDGAKVMMTKRETERERGREGRREMAEEREREKLKCVFLRVVSQDPTRVLAKVQ